MKNLKKLLGSMLALMLVFCSLSAGTVALAAETSQAATVPFASFKVDGKKANLNKYPVYSVLNYTKTTAQVKWTTNEGWEVKSASYENESYKKVSIKSGDKVKVPKDGGVQVDIVVKDPEDNTETLELNIYSGKPKLLGSTLWMSSGKNWLEWDGVNGDAEVLSIKSSNTSVLKVKKANKLWDCTVTPKGAGKAKVTVKLNINGKKKSLSANYTVKKYPKPLTQVKVAGKAVDLKKNKFTAKVKVKKDKTKVDFKVAKGWKLESCGYFYDKTRKFVAIKSGSKVKTPKSQSDGGGVWVTFLLTKGGDSFWYELNLVR